MDFLHKQIYDFVTQMLQIPKYRSILVSKSNKTLEFLLEAEHEAYICEMLRKYGDNYES